MSKWSLDELAASLTPEVVDAIESLADYVAADEADDYAESYPESRGSHVFRAVTDVSNWLYGGSQTPEELAEELTGIACTEGEDEPGPAGPQEGG